MVDKKIGAYSPERAREISENVNFLMGKAGGVPPSYGAVEIAPIPIVNITNETIPAYGCVEVEVPSFGTQPSRATFDRYGGYLLQVRKPQRFFGQTYLLNGPAEITPGGTSSVADIGSAQVHPSWFIGRVESLDNCWTGNRFSHQRDEFELIENYAGPYVCLGVFDEDEKLIHGAIQTDPPHKLFKVDSNGIGAASSGTPAIGYGTPIYQTDGPGSTGWGQSLPRLGEMDTNGDESGYQVELLNYGSAVAADATVHAKVSGYRMVIDVEYC